jgi:hypothetical protein
MFVPGTGRGGLPRSKARSEPVRGEDFAAAGQLRQLYALGQGL